MDPNEIKVNPNRAGVMRALSSDEMLTRDQFYKIMSPETHQDLTPPDSLDNLFHNIGVLTPRVQQLRKAASVEKQLDPLYEQYAQLKLPSSTNPSATLGEARGISPNFPAPPNAQTYAEAQGPGAPVSTGIMPGNAMS